MRHTHIRGMIRADFPAVLAIEHASFDDPWSEDHFLCALRQRNCIGLVAERGSEIAGFVIYSLMKTRIFIGNFAVRPDHRRDGVGGTIVDKLIGKLDAIRRNRIEIMVRDGNLSGQLFFRSQGFVATYVDRGYFDDTGEDGYRFVYRIDEPEDDMGSVAGAARQEGAKS